MLDPVISLLAAFCGALLFGWAATHKWRAPREFAATLAAYRLLPAPLAAATALVLTLLETAVCMALLWPATRLLGGAIGSALLLLYACAMALNLARGRRNLDCGCSLVRRAISGGMVLRNLALAAALAMPSIPTTARALVAADYATVGAALLVSVLLYASAELLLGRPAWRALPATEPS